MKVTWKTPQLILALGLFMASWLFLNLFLTLVCEAHIPVHNPPGHGPPMDMIVPGVSNTIPGSRTPGPGLPGTRPIPIPGRTGGVGPAGASTLGAKKKGTLTTTPITWEYWWARNRYQFLDFPELSSQGTGRYPATPDLDNGPAELNMLRNKSFALMRPLLTDKSARLRRASLISLGMLDDEDSLPSVLELLRDGNQTVRDAAVLSLGLMQNSEAKHTLLHIAQGSRAGCDAIGQTTIPDYFRGFAQVSLALEETAGLDGLLQTIALDPESAPEVQAMALEGIGLLGGEESARFLIRFTENSKSSPQLLAAAVTALCKTEEPVILPFLENCLQSKHLAMRQSAALGLGCIAPSGDPAALEKLMRCIRTESSQVVKGFALLSMGMIGGKGAAAYLDQEMMKGSRAVCAWACLGLGFALQQEQNPKYESHLIRQATTHANRSTRSAAAIALGLMKSAKAVAPLMDRLEKGDDPFYRGYCAMALGMIGDPAALPALRKRVARSYREVMVVKAQTAMALALFHDKDSVLDLVDLMLDTDNDNTKGFIALSLSYMGDPRIVDRIFKATARNTLDDITLLHCVRLTAKLVSGRTAPYLDRVAAGSNFASEYPIVGYLLDFGI